jgi:signal peptidase I
VLLTAFLVGQKPSVHPTIADLSTPLDVASVNTASMYPALQIGDVVLVDKMAYAFHAPRDGDVAVVVPPIDLVGKTLTARVIGVPGDTIDLSNGALRRNGTVIREPYVYGENPYDLTVRNNDIYVDNAPIDRRFGHVPPKALWQAPNRIPSGYYLLLGDNRAYAIDSRTWGFVQRAGFVGVPVAVLWPLDRLKNFR